MDARRLKSEKRGSPGFCRVPVGMRIFNSRPSDLHSNARRGFAAFTLIEVVIGLTILAMITGTLFAIVRGAVRGAAEIEQVQRENDSINRLIELCRQTFQTMPATATLTLEIKEQSTPVMQELTISGAPHCFGFGTSPTSYKDSIIGLQADPNGAVSEESGLPLYDLSLSREDLIPVADDNELAIRQDSNSAIAPDEEGRYWMPLLQGVNSLTWRFYKKDEEVWEEEWSRSQWPDLIEMNLVMNGRTLPLRAVFAVPVIELRAGSGGSQQTPSSTTTTTSPSANPPTGGNQSGGGAPSGGTSTGGGGGGR